jgi:hypothetical protein
MHKIKTLRDGKLIRVLLLGGDGDGETGYIRYDTIDSIIVTVSKTHILIDSNISYDNTCIEVIDTDNGDITSVPIKKGKNWVIVDKVQDIKKHEHDRRESISNTTRKIYRQTKQLTAAQIIDKYRKD